MIRITAPESRSRHVQVQPVRFAVPAAVCASTTMRADASRPSAARIRRASTRPETLSRLGVSGDGLSVGRGAGTARANTVRTSSRRKRRSPFLVEIAQRFFTNPINILLTVLAVVSWHRRRQRSARVDHARDGVHGGVPVVLPGSAHRPRGRAVAAHGQQHGDGAARAAQPPTSADADVSRRARAEDRGADRRTWCPATSCELSAGDMIPADVRLLAAKDLFVTQAALTGESLPVEKFAGIDARCDGAARRAATSASWAPAWRAAAPAAWSSPPARAPISARWPARSIGRRAPTSFDQGMQRFTWLMIRFMVVMVPLVFLINGLTKDDWQRGVLLRPGRRGRPDAGDAADDRHRLPRPRARSRCRRKKVIVKRLNSIQNFGAMDVLCTDKTGTLTHGPRHPGAALRRRRRGGRATCCAYAYLNSHFQTGLKNLLDRAVLDARRAARAPASAAEYAQGRRDPVRLRPAADVGRRARRRGGQRLPDRKGAPEEVFARCTQLRAGRRACRPMDAALLDDLTRASTSALSADGFRVLARRRTRDARARKPRYSQGRRARPDPARATSPSSTRPRTRAGRRSPPCSEHGVAVKVLTGDNDLVSRKICREVGLAADARAPRPARSRRCPTTELADAARDTHAVRPALPAAQAAHHQGAASATGHVVGFLGDGINDAPGPARRRRRHLGGHGGRHRQGVGRRHPAGEEPAGAGGGRASRAARSSPTSSSTSAWAPAPTSATCSACSAPAPSCRSCRWPRSRS